MAKKAIGRTVSSIRNVVSDFINNTVTASASTLPTGSSATLSITNDTLDIGVPEGPKGDTGPQGPTGPEGPEGPQGPEGPEGPEGPQGNRGPRGFDGADGSDGSQGPQGPQGPAGPNEIDGTTSVTGDLDITGHKIFGQGGTDTSALNLEVVGIQCVFIEDVSTGPLEINNSINVDGDVTGDSKNFVIDHPTKDNYQLRHGAYEGPVSGGLIYRDTVRVINGTAKPDFPDYVLDDEFGTDWTSHITPDDHFGTAYLDTDSWTIHADTDGKYDVMVVGQRTDDVMFKNQGGVTTRKDDESWNEASARYYNGADDIDSIEFAHNISELDETRVTKYEQAQQTTDTTTN